MAIAHNIDVLLQAKTDGYDKKLKASEKRTKEFADKAKPWLESLFGKSGGGLAGSFLQGGAMAAGAVVAIGAINLLTTAIKGAFNGLKQLVAEGFTDLDQLGDMAKRLAINAGALTTLQFAAIKSGSSAEDLNSSLQRMSRNLAEAGAAAGGPVNEALAELGINAEQLAGLSVEDKFKMIADGMAGISDNGKRLALINDIFGKTGSSLNELLAGGGKSIDGFNEKAKKLGLVFSDGEVAKVGDAVGAWESFGMALKGLGQSFAVALAPLGIGLGDLATDSIATIISYLNPLFELIRQWSPAIIQMANITVTVFRQIMDVCLEVAQILMNTFGGPILELLSYFGGDITNLAETVTVALAFVEAVIERWQQIWEIAFASVALSMITFGNDCLNIFGTVLPNLFTNFAKATSQLFLNLANNVMQAFKMIWNVITTGGIGKVNFKPLFDGFKSAAINAAKDLARPATEMEKQLQKTLDQQSKKLSFDIAEDMTARIGELKSLITDDKSIDFSSMGGGFDDEMEATVTTKLAPGALERGSSAAFEAIINAQDQQSNPVVAEIVKGNKLQAKGNDMLAEIAANKNQLAIANFR